MPPRAERRGAWQATFPGGKHELSVTTYQMCILLLFNSADQLSYKEIAAATDIPAGDLRRNLQSLACVKARYDSACLPSRRRRSGAVVRGGASLARMSAVGPNRERDCVRRLTETPFEVLLMGRAGELAACAGL